MKKTLYTILLLLLTASCDKGATQNTMTVSGKVKGLKKGTLYLQHLSDSTLIVIDSIQVDGEGNFSFKTEVESPEIFYLYLSKKDYNEVNDRITFFGEPGQITINTKWNAFDTKAKIKGSKTHKKLEEYQKTMSRFNVRGLEIAQSSLHSKTPLDSLQTDSIQKLAERNMKRGYAYALNFALNNKGSYIAPYIALHEVPDANVKYLDSINNSLAPEVADSKYGRALNEHLGRMKTSKQ